MTLWKRLKISATKWGDNTATGAGKKELEVLLKRERERERRRASSSSSSLVRILLVYAHLKFNYREKKTGRRRLWTEIREMELWSAGWRGIRQTTRQKKRRGFISGDIAYIGDNLTDSKERDYLIGTKTPSTTQNSRLSNGNLPWKGPKPDRRLVGVSRWGFWNTRSVRRLWAIVYCGLRVLAIFWLVIGKHESKLIKIQQSTPFYHCIWSHNQRESDGTTGIAPGVILTVKKGVRNVLKGVFMKFWVLLAIFRLFHHQNPFPCRPVGIYALYDFEIPCL